MYKKRLFAPGPVEVPPQVLQAMAEPMVHHRSKEFQDLFSETRGKLASLALVPNEDVLILAATGTAAFEAGLLACVPKGSKIIGINAGKFGERWVKVAKVYSYEVIEFKLEWGKVAPPEAIAELLAEHPDAKALTTTHSETSTGTLHDVQSIARLAREQNPDLLILVDCVTSLGTAEVNPRAWEIDGMFSGSQKGLMTPPGLGFAWLSERAWASTENLNPSFYLDLRKERKVQNKGQTAYTAAVSLVKGLNAALTLLLAEGLENVWQRRQSMNLAVLEAAKLLGCLPFAQRVSPAVAALHTPEGLSAPDIVGGFAERGMRIAGGQDHAKPVLFRPSVMGYVDPYDVVMVVAVLEDVLRSLGRDIPYGKATSKALEVLKECKSFCE